MNFRKYIKDILETEKFVWKNNKDEILNLNHKILKILSMSFFICFFSLFIFSNFSNEIRELKTIFLTISIIFIIIRIISHKKRSLLFTMLTIYITGLLLCYLAVMSTKLIMPNAASTFIISFIFIYSMTVFDKSKRVNVFVITMTIVYIILFDYYKISSSTSMDIINVCGVSVFNIFLGGYLRHLQFENIYLKQLDVVKVHTDPLTNLKNRRALSLIEDNKPLLNEIKSLIMVDVDYFKLYNDEYGHQKGDECLIVLSNIFLEFQTKYNMTFYRYGGEEFTAVIWKNENKDSIEICEELLNDVTKLKIKHKKSKFKIVTLSIGVSIQNDKKSLELSNLLKNADKALYKSKKDGRNKISY